MTDANRVKKVLLSLPEAELRVGWLEDQLNRWPSDRSARVLNELLEESESAEPAAREVLFTVALVFSGRADAPWVKQLRVEAIEQRLFSLERLLRKAPPSLVSVPPNEGRVPDYGAGRELTLGERRSLARRPDRRAFDKLREDPHPMVIRLLLENPKMTEEDVVRLATRRPARVEVIHEIGRSARWVRRARVRMAILLNPGSPPEVSMVLLGLCTRGELREVIQNSLCPVTLRATAVELLARRPPMAGAANDDRVLQ